MREDVDETDLPMLPKRQLAKIKSKMKSSWFTSLMLKKKVPKKNIVNVLEKEHYVGNNKLLFRHKKVNIICNLFNKIVNIIRRLRK